MTKFLHGFFSFGWLRGLDFLPPLLFRFFLAPIFWVEGSQRLGLFTGENIVIWNPLTWVNNAVYQKGVESLSNVQGLIPIPVPEIMNGVIGGVEVAAAILLILGFAVRWISLPLMGILVILGLAAANFSGGFIETSKELLLSHGYMTPLNGGIESTLTLFLMVLALFFIGAGRFFSLDWLIHHRYYKKIARQNNDNTRQANDEFDVNLSN